MTEQPERIFCRINCSDLILDVLDELLYELDFNENYYVVKINLTSVDNALETLYGFNGIKGIAGGDIAALDLSAVLLNQQQPHPRRS